MNTPITVERLNQMSYSKKCSVLFNDVAELYDRVRPGYPDSVVERVLACASVPEDGKILEVGCGTGQLTVPLAKRGYEITAIDRGPDLAHVASQNCSAFSKTRIINSTFEEWEGVLHSFDLVTSAQTYHWFDPNYGIQHASSSLKHTGSIALIWNVQNRSRDTDFWRATDPVYEKYRQASTAGHKPLEWSIEAYRKALDDSILFEDPVEITEQWNMVYSHDDYIMLLNTYSDHISLPEPQKSAFFSEISEIIMDFGGQVERLYETIAIVANKRTVAFESI